jgi:hypothetical protein
VTWAAWLGAAFWTSLLLGSCARTVTVGHEDSLTSGGAATDEDLLWSADHEGSAFDEWLDDGQGIQFTERQGQLALTSERAHSGSSAFTATITTGNDQLQQAMMGRNIRLSEGRYGAWYLLPEAPRADYWVIMKLSNGSSKDRFDIDIEAKAGGGAHLRLFEHTKDWITEPASVDFPIGRWVHVEALYRSTPSSNGRLIVLQDGQPVLDSGPRYTADDDYVTFFCGSTSRSVMPSPFRLFIDDASIGLGAP